MKRWFSLVAVVVLCLSLVIGVACGGDDDEDEAEIKIGVIGPMAYVQGEHHWYGAQLAAEEINAEGGVLVGGES